MEILKERVVKIGKFSLKSVFLKIEISEKNKEGFLEKFRLKFSRGGG